jgi:hypothetical protein
MDRFFFQNVELDTQLFIIDDAKKNLDFEALFSKMTEGLTIERKNQKSFHIPFENSPKFLISTNYVLPNDSDSHKARKLEIEFSDYYSATYTPLDDFGVQFFNGWDQSEWDKFYSFMMHCTLLYLQKGLKDYQKANLEQRKFEAYGIPFEFEDFVFDLIKNLDWDKRIPRAVLSEKFIENHKSFQNKSNKLFTLWFKRILTFNKIEFEEKNSNGRYFLINNIPEDYMKNLNLVT